MVLTNVSLSPIAAMPPGLSCGAVYVTVKGLRSPTGTLIFMLSTLSPATITDGLYEQSWTMAHVAVVKAVHLFVHKTTWLVKIHRVSDISHACTYHRSWYGVYGEFDRAASGFALDTDHLHCHRLTLAWSKRLGHSDGKLQILTGIHSCGGGCSCGGEGISKGSCVCRPN